jgi:hypothetical protein
VGLLAGCGSSASRSASVPELALERAQFVRVSTGLESAEAAVGLEVRAARGAWPSIYGGLPAAPPSSLKGAVARASASAAALPEAILTADPAKLTGPAAGIAGIYEDYVRLTQRGWQLVGASIATISSGTPSQASFARANSSLYISAVYDGHYDLSLLGKSLSSGYEKLGGAAAFAAKLTPAAVAAIATAYSIPTVRLTPHPAGAGREG